MMLATEREFTDSPVEMSTKETFTKTTDTEKENSNFTMVLFTKETFAWVVLKDSVATSLKEATTRATGDETSITAKVDLNIWTEATIRVNSSEDRPTDSE